MFRISSKGFVTKPFDKIRENITPKTKFTVNDFFSQHKNLKN